MRTTFFTLCLLSIFSSLLSQPVLYGTARDGGTFEKGTIVRFEATKSSLVAEHHFEGVNGANPEGKLLQAKDGLIYGTTRSGGTESKGTIFSFDPVSKKYSKLYDFTGLDGANPVGTMIQAKNAKLYGMCTNGGVNGNGTIFSYTIENNAFEKLLDFNGLNGANPDGGLLEATNEILYGVTPQGGAGTNGPNGVLFSFNPETNIFTKLHDFNGGTGLNSDGINPTGTLLQATNALLYGVTKTGGSLNIGTIFSYEISSSKYKLIHSFESFDANRRVLSYSPTYGLFQNSTGRIWGTFGRVEPEGGMMFSFMPPIDNAVLPPNSVQYVRGNEAFYVPSGTLMEASNGNNYVVLTWSGGNPFALFYQGVIIENFSLGTPKAYFNSSNGINTPNGRFPRTTLIELRSCTPPVVTIPDANALNMGVEANTVYSGYAPASSITLKSEVNSSTDTHTFQWSNGATTPSINVSPTNKTLYTVTVSNSLACVATASKEIKVVDVSCGNKLNKVQICHLPPGNPANAKTLCIDATDVINHLQKGSYLGACTSASLTKSNSSKKEKLVNTLTLEAYPIPSKNYFTLKLKGDGRTATLRVFDVNGRLMETRSVNTLSVIQLGHSLKPGIYYVELLYDGNKTITKLFKQ